MSEVYEFEGYLLNCAKRVLADPSGASLKLGPKAFETLVELVRRHSEIVTRDELLEAVWPDTIVEENNLTQCISALRKAFEESPGEQRFIATIPGLGYKFVAEVRRVVPSGSPDVRGSQDGFAPDPVSPPREAPAGKRFLIAVAVLLTILLVSSAYYIGYFRNAAEGSGDLRSVAVLPFNPMPGQPVNEAMQLGMTESLITQLGKSDRLQVRPLSAIRKYASPERDPFAAGRELGVDVVIDGNIQIADGKVRVTARLFRVADGKQLWAESYNEPLRDLFSLQDSISEKAASALKARLSPDVRNHRTENLEAYELYLRGRVHVTRLVKPEVEKGISYFEKAILADPTYALPHVGISEAQRALLLSNDAKGTEVVPRAKVAALRAVELAPDLAEARAALGMIAFFYDWDWKESELQLKKSIEIGGNDPELLIFYAHFCSNLGRTDEALSFAARAHDAAPTNLLVGVLEGQFFLHGRRVKDAVSKLRAVIELNDGYWLSHQILASALVDDGRYAEAEKEAIRAKQLAPYQTQSEAFRAYALVGSGRTNDARDILKALLARERTTYVPPVNIAMVYAALGEKDKAIKYLEKGYEEKDVRMSFLKVERKWDPLRNEPGFKALLVKMDLD
jgi:DNA-binding winged helix-turn-helix (wHTH) protein/TolB-like protein/Flp pilus assembly protein TadD